jgi:hypothetical protein
MPANTRPAVGWIGLGDQGLPMAVAIAGAGYPLHVSARHPDSLDALSGTPHVRHGELRNLAAACDIIGLCVSTDIAACASRPGPFGSYRPPGLPATGNHLDKVIAAHQVQGQAHSQNRDDRRKIIIVKPITRGAPRAVPAAGSFAGYR